MNVEDQFIASREQYVGDTDLTESFECFDQANELACPHRKSHAVVRHGKSASVVQLLGRIMENFYGNMMVN